MKRIIKYFSIVFVCLVVLILLFTFSSSIPKKAIQKNLKETYDFIKTKKEYANIIKNIDATKMDIPADLMILNLTASQNSNHPFKSLLASKYYNDYLVDNKNDLKKITNNNIKPNEQYLRYWHGSITIIKPLLVFFNLKQIIIINYLLLSIFLTILLVMLYKENKRLSVVTLVAFISCYSFFVPMTLEYSWNYYLAIIISIIVLKREKKHKDIYPLFLISGVCTCFFDFLTTETLTLTLPLVLLFIIRINNKKEIIEKDVVKELIKCCILWLLAYVITWFCKWILASVVLNINAYDFVYNRAMNRVIGRVCNSFINQILFSIIDNCSNIIIFSCFAKYKRIVFLIVFLLLFSFFYLYRKQKKELFIVKILLLIGIIPIIRYSVLSNHSYVHSCFTYRALLSSIICLYYIFYYGVDINLLKTIKKRLKIKKNVEK